MRAGIILGALAALLNVFSAHAADVSGGAMLYEAYCAQCHGGNGAGTGINVPHLKVQPRNHTDRAEMSARTDAELFKAIKHGGQAVNKSTLMPNWDGNLTDTEINDLVAHLRLLCCASAEQGVKQ